MFPLFCVNAFKFLWKWKLLWELQNILEYIHLPFLSTYYQNMRMACNCSIVSCVLPICYCLIESFSYSFSCFTLLPITVFYPVMYSRTFFIKCTCIVNLSPALSSKQFRAIRKNTFAWVIQICISSYFKCYPKTIVSTCPATVSMPFLFFVVSNSFCSLIQSLCDRIYTLWSIALLPRETTLVGRMFVAIIQ